MSKRASMSQGLTAGRAFLVLACIAAAVAPLRAAVADGGNDDQYSRYSGTAVSRHSARFLYGEEHVLHSSQGRLLDRVVLYTCADGTPFARKTITYVDPLAPDFLLEVASNGMQEGVRTVGTERSVFFRGDRLRPERTGPLPAVRGLVADAGFDEFIRAHWQTLMSGQSQELHFLVPSRLDELAFSAQHLRSDSVNGMSTETFRLKLAGVWGWVLPGIDVAYQADDHTLIRFDGISDLRDASGDNFQTVITFPASGRGPASAETSAAARRAPLAPCT